MVCLGRARAPPPANISSLESLELLLAARSNVIFIFSDFFNFPFHLPLENKHTDETLARVSPREVWKELNIDVLG